VVPETDAGLFTIASPGRSGTMWYSQLFTTAGSHCFHELTTLIRRYPTNIVLGDRMERETADLERDPAQRRFPLEVFPEYFGRLWEAGQGREAAGNSDQFVTPFLSGLWLLWPQMRFLFSFRNGINQVASMAGWEASAEQALLASWRVRYGTADYFERCCCDWSATVGSLEAHRNWLRGQGAEVLETRFERVIGDPDELARVWNGLLGRSDDATERNRALAGTVVNARSEADRVLSPDEVWESWTPDRRRTFTDLCGGPQRRLGYTLPSTS